jgi:hypothetical protein
MENHVDGTPLSIQTSGFFIVLVVLGALALLTALSPGGHR